MRLSQSVLSLFGARPLLWSLSLAWFGCAATGGALFAKEDAGSENSPATHKQESVIECCKTADGMKLEDFCAANDGRVLALVSPARATAILPAKDDEEESLEEAAARSPDQLSGEVRLFDAEGKLVKQWKLDFHGQAINVGPDGSVYVGGAGRLAKYDLKGTLLAQDDAPQASVLKDPEKLRDAAAAQLKQEKEMYRQAMESMQQNVKVLEEQANRRKKRLAQPGTSDDKRNEGDKESGDADDDNDESPAEESDIALLATPEGQLKLYRSQVKLYANHLKQLEKKTVDDAVKDVIASRMAINAIAVGEQDVYVACRAEKGYGYAIWKTDLKFGNPQQIVSNLVGCCGQMDIQARGDEVWVAENARHRVVKYNREGKQLLAFGKRDREGLGECFSGCCNPMNLCFDTSGDLLVSESNGVVKRFNDEGKYLEAVGTADVRPGCKNSAVGVTPDGRRVFYIDIQKSKVIVLKRAEDKQASLR